MTMQKTVCFNYFIENKIPNPLAVTLTLKQGRSYFNNYGLTIKKPDLIDYQRNTKHFLNRLNQKIFKHAFRRYGAKIQVIPIFEGTLNTRIHIHLIIERPDFIKLDEFELMIQDCWTKTQFGYNNIHIKELDNYERWVNYILKNRTKQVDLLDSIDVENMHINLR